jgi:antitoxin component of RelBE/YafQ-DinJ toxin-antitoxin module
MPGSSRGYVNIRLDDENLERLKAIAEDAGVAPGRAASLLLSELLPTVKAIRPRIQVIRHERSAA